MSVNDHNITSDHYLLPIIFIALLTILINHTHRAAPDILWPEVLLPLNMPHIDPCIAARIFSQLLFLLHVKEVISNKPCSFFNSIQSVLNMYYPYILRSRLPFPDIKLINYGLPTPPAKNPNHPYSLPQQR
jgi:hypothetical protein